MEQRDIVFASRHMELVVETSRRIANTPSPVLIEGESGTGKELVARLIHSLSDRKDRSFVPVNCGAIPESLFESEFFGYRAGAFTGALRDKRGMFEIASGGTIFLDEIGDLSLAMQAKCLRVLQENELRRIGDTAVSRIDVRVISATNKDLEKEMEAGRLREDLFFRVSVLRVYIEPLRERREDIEVLCDHFIKKHCRMLGRKVPVISDEVMDILGEYAWPGNVRELENEIQRMMALLIDGKPITPSHVSRRIMDHVRGGVGKGPEERLKTKLASYEKQIIKEALDLYGWNKTRAAKHLGLTRQGLHKKLQRLRIRRHESG